MIVAASSTSPSSTSRCVTKRSRYTDGCNYPDSRRFSPVLVDHPAEPVYAMHRALALGRGAAWLGSRQREPAMRALSLVVSHILSEGPLHMTPAEHQEVVQALAPHGLNPAFGERVGLARTRGGADDMRRKSTQTSSTLRHYEHVCSTQYVRSKYDSKSATRPARLALGERADQRIGPI